MEESTKHTGKLISEHPSSPHSDITIPILQLKNSNNSPTHVFPLLPGYTMFAFSSLSRAATKLRRIYYKHSADRKLSEGASGGRCVFASDRFKLSHESNLCRFPILLNAPGLPVQIPLFRCQTVSFADLPAVQPVQFLKLTPSSLPSPLSSSQCVGPRCERCGRSMGGCQAGLARRRKTPKAAAGRQRSNSDRRTRAFLYRHRPSSNKAQYRN